MDKKNWSWKKKKICDDTQIIIFVLTSQLGLEFCDLAWDIFLKYTLHNVQLRVYFALMRNVVTPSQFWTQIYIFSLIASGAAAMAQ